jgi:hypothetical protein
LLLRILLAVISIAMIGLAGLSAYWALTAPADWIRRDYAYDVGKALLMGLPAICGFFWFGRDESASLQGEVKAAKDYIRGTVRGFQARTETTYSLLQKQVWNLNVWTFRIERRDSHGNRLQPVPAEMRGYWFSGFLNEGDEVEVYCPDWREGATIHPTRLRNLTTRSIVRPTKTKSIFTGGLMSLIPIGGLALVILWWFLKK